MAIHWQIPFKSLRSGTDYVANIYDASYDSTPVKLMGGAQPFSTSEDQDEDMFTPVRTQSGYIRIVDNGKDADGNDFNWRDMLPLTDTDRPVTLTKKVGNNWVVVWQGFMQAQNFGSTLYGNPQEHELPIQCVLTVTQGTDINYEQKAIQNFAYLLKQIVDSIPDGFRPTSYVVQGGAHAQQWLMKCIDWMNFSEEDNDGVLEARYTMFECLEDMCRFWGWTARTHGQTMYLMCPDDTVEQSLLTLTYSELGTMAGGTSAGTTNGSMQSVSISGDVFASIDNQDAMMRGFNKSVVSANAGDGNSDIDFDNDQLIDEMTGMGWQFPFVVIDSNLKYTVYITNDLTSFSQAKMSGAVRTNYGSFNRMNITVNGDRDNSTETSIVRIKKSGPSNLGSNVNPYVTIETLYEHAFGDGFIELSGTIYRKGERYQNTDDMSSTVGRNTMIMRLGIGKTRNSAYWWTSNVSCGGAWFGPGQPDVMYFKCTIGNGDEKFRVLTPGGTYVWITRIPVNSAIAGKIFVDFLGSNDLDAIDGEKQFDISNFSLKFTRNENYLSDYAPTRDERENRREYTSKNQNRVRNEWNRDMIYASDNKMVFGYGVLINADYSYFKGFQYVQSGPLVFPENHLAKRVTDYCATSKRKIEADLRANVYVGAFISDISPVFKATIDQSTMYPIAINHEWRDDVVRLTMLEL